MSSKTSKNTRPAKRRAGETTKRPGTKVPSEPLRIHEAATRGFGDVQFRLYCIKAKISAAHALAHAQDENCDLALILDSTASELQVIVDEMGNHLPVYVPGGGTR